MTPDQTVLTILEGISGLKGGVYDGQVPDQIPSDGKYVRPYAVLWAGTGGDLPDERDLTGLTDVHGLDWRPQVTVVAASASVCRDAARAVRLALTNVPVPGGGWLQPDDDLNRQLVPIPDNTITPARVFLPLRFRAVTTQ